MMTEKINLDVNFNRAESILKEKEIEYVREDECMAIIERHIIRAKDDSWDFICSTGSYGANEGKLEFWSKKLENSGEEPIGWLSAEEVVGLIEAGS